MTAEAHSCDILRSARVGIVEAQGAYSHGRPVRTGRLSAFYAGRARERLAEARRIRERSA